jgi:hypothetical protein
MLDKGAPQHPASAVLATAAAITAPAAIAETPPPAAIARALAYREAAEIERAQAAAADAAKVAGQEDSASSNAGQQRQDRDAHGSQLPAGTAVPQKRPVESSASVPWRQPGRKVATVSTASQRGQYESEMLDITDNMKGLAQSWTQSLQRDSKVLEEIHNSVDDSQRKAEAENKKAKAMLWAGSLSFFKTMLMLAVSIIIFFLMIPFIIIT